MRNLPIAIAAMAVLAALVGCNRVASVTTLNPDGSLHEKLSLKVSNMQEMFAFGDTKGTAGAPKGDPFAKAFRFDKTGATVTKSTQSDVSVLTLERNLSASRSPHPDFQILSDKGAPETDCKVAGIKLPNGDIEFDAVIKYLGPPESNLLNADPTVRAAVKSALPARLREASTIDGLSHAIEVGLMRSLLGPPEPEFTSLMINPDVSALKLGSELKAVIEAEAPKYLKELTRDQLRAVVQKVMEALNVTNLMEQQKSSHMGSTMGASGKAGSTDASGMTSLVYEVSFKGAVVKTNGILDPLSGHVYWCFYAMSAVLGEVKLHLVVRPR